ncbi:MAG: ferrous iron transport protein A [Verrucomicrobiales bacterium]|nr:ferrous iron transport protein A [Verrucomicrobiales bacterium]
MVRLAGDNSFQNRLREMGIVESAQISVLNVNGSVHCQVKDSRFGLSRAAAEEVFVELG